LTDGCCDAITSNAVITCCKVILFSPLFFLYLQPNQIYKMKEIWKEIEGFEGLYKVSNFGNVKSCERTRKSKSGSLSIVHERILKQKSDKDGYKSVALCLDGKLYYRRVHRLMAIAFIPNPNHFPLINHKDEDVTNNVVSNLEWRTPSYNTQYSKHKVSFKIKCNDVVYPSIKACSRALNIDAKCIRYRLRVGGLYKGVYKFTFV
jgi:hypothetical protein